MENIDEKNSVLNGQIKAYEGSDDYAFVSYADEDLDLVLPNLAIFDELGVNIFYNDGLSEPITSFPNIAEKVKNSNMLIPFLTPNVNLSSWTGKGILIAFLHKKHIIPIYLKETVLDDQLQRAMGKCSSILLYDMDSEEYKRSFSNEYETISSKIEEENKFGLIDSAKNLVSSNPKTKDVDNQKNESPETTDTGVVSGAWATVKKFFANGTQASIFKQESNDDGPQVEELPRILEKFAKMSKDIDLAYGLHQKMYNGVGEESPKIQSGRTMHLCPDMEPIYLSFSYENIDLIFNDIMRFNSSGLDFKFDDSIDFNDDKGLNINWFNEVEYSLENSSLFIFYASNTSVKSIKRNFELLYAIKKNLSVYFVYIEESSSIDSLLYSIIRYPKIQVFK